MNGTILGIAVIVGIGLAITLVNIAISKMTISDLTRMYDGMLEKRKNEILDLSRDREALSRRCAELEAKLSTERYNKPQEEFFTVPSKKAYKEAKVSYGES